METTNNPVAEVVLTDLDDHEVHYACCSDETMRMCGQPTNPGGWTDEDVTCEACVKAYRNGICPLGEMCVGLPINESELNVAMS